MTYMPAFSKEQRDFATYIKRYDRTSEGLGKVSPFFLVTAELLTSLGVTCVHRLAHATSGAYSLWDVCRRQRASKAYQHKGDTSNNLHEVAPACGSQRQEAPPHCSNEVHCGRRFSPASGKASLMGARVSHEPLGEDDSRVIDSSSTPFRNRSPYLVYMDVSWPPTESTALSFEALIKKKVVAASPTPFNFVRHLARPFSFYQTKD